MIITVDLFDVIAVGILVIALAACGCVIAVEYLKGKRKNKK